MLTRFVSMTCLLTLCSACATAPTACPALPPPPVLGQPGPSFQSLMDGFLAGKLPEQTNYELTSKPAAVGLKR